LNEAGLRLASVCGVDRVENWSGLTQQEKRTQKELWMDRLTADLDRQFPASPPPLFIARWQRPRPCSTISIPPGGAVYGFAPEGSGPIHIAPGTAIDGLWLASAYTFAGGYTGAMVGGAMAARAAITAANVRAKAPHAS
jgi:all-trans-retinol 13,14-reductase